MSMPEYSIIKGTRIRARWFEAKLTCLAGVQDKLGATLHEVTGTVRHIRGNHPTNPTFIRLYVEADDGLGSPCGKCQVREVEIDPKHVVEILKDARVDSRAESSSPSSQEGNPGREGDGA